MPDGAELHSCRDGECNVQLLPRFEHCVVGIRLEVRVALGGLEALVAEEVLDLVEETPFWTSHEAQVWRMEWGG